MIDEMTKYLASPALNCGGFSSRNGHACIILTVPFHRVTRTGDAVGKALTAPGHERVGRSAERSSAQLAHMDKVTHMDDDARSIPPMMVEIVRAPGIGGASTARRLSIAELTAAIFFRGYTMAELSPHGSRFPLAIFSNLSEADRLSYRRWTRGWSAGCAIALAAVMAIGFWSRSPDLQAGSEHQTVGVGQAHRHHPGG
jgi:hypothetical protein